jgi:hypothetical protein
MVGRISGYFLYLEKSIWISAAMDHDQGNGQIPDLHYFFRKEPGKYSPTRSSQHKGRERVPINYLTIDSQQKNDTLWMYK